MAKRNSERAFSKAVRLRLIRLMRWIAPAFLAGLFVLWRAASPQSNQELDRRRLDQLASEEKFEEATKEAARLRQEAKNRGDDSGWAWALIKEVQLRIALHGYETSVRFLKEEEWPLDPLQRNWLNLFYARSLMSYYEAYSWEINRREKTEAKEAVDLKSWTREQIFGEAWTALLRVWDDRARLQKFKARDFPDYWRAGDYPAGIRDTLRDSVVYLLARLLMDTRSWTPRQTNELFLLDLDSLSGDPPGDKAAAEIMKSPDSHPLEKLSALLGEHESFCQSAGRPEGALEARLERLQALHGSFTKPEDRTLIRKRLAEFLAKCRAYPWWATGQAVLAEMTRAEDAADSLIRAHRLAQDGVEAYPDSPGGRRCLHIVKSIEAPRFSVDIMMTDAPGKRSIQVTHRNLERLFFRVYPVDLTERIRNSRDYNLFPLGREGQAILEKSRPAAAWKAELPATPDFKDHKTYVDLPAGLMPGFYLVASSAREDFARKKNSIEAHPAMVADLVLLKRDRLPGGVEALVLSGESGKPVPEAKVELYAFDWQKGHNLVESQVTDSEGRVHFASRRRSGPFFLLAKKGKDMVLDASYLYLYGREKPQESSSSLIYTDRSVYRPGQKLYWKILAYKGRPDEGSFQPAVNSAATVWLEDINGQRVAEAVRTTNEFGTASGEFAIPAAGRPLGIWRLRAQPQGYAQVRVEEYKRPTFEVTIKDPEKPLRLNRPAALKAEAKYYFGLPVASGTAVWQVRRAPVYPRWWWWESGPTQAQIIAGGRSELAEDGTFEASFTPRADERKDRPEAGLTYNYTLSVDVTDEGGETRSASRTFRLGFVSVEASITAGLGFFREGMEGAFKIRRADLNGTAKPGKGLWRVVELIQPDSTNLPSDQPLPETQRDKEAEKYQTPGDRLRPRWAPAPSPESILFLWKEGPELAKGTAEHNEKGEAVVNVKNLEAGAYRLLYETKDDFGAVCRERLDFLVAGKEASVRLPLVLSAERSTVCVGETARLLVYSGWEGQPFLLETFKGGETLKRRWIMGGVNGGVIEIPVDENLRGGFGARVTLLKDHQFMSEAANVFVPWDNKELELSFSFFRDKLVPGGRETWRVNVKTPSGKAAVEGAAELLAYMYDRSLEIFAPHRPPNLLNIYPNRVGSPSWDSVLGMAPQAYSEDSGWFAIPSYVSFGPDDLIELEEYGIGGPGGRVLGGVVGGVLGRVVPSPAAREKEARTEAVSEEAMDRTLAEEKQTVVGLEVPSAEPAQLRSKFDETAFWQPHLLTGPDGTAAIEFTVPDSVTGWRVFVHGVTRDLMGGSLEKEAVTVKQLMVRPYLPRFFREGDKAELRVMVNNDGEAILSGAVSLEIFDPVSSENLAPAFGLPENIPPLPFTAKPGGAGAVIFNLTAPARVGTAAFKVTAKSGALSDGELRPLPILPGRMHLVQSRFATLKEGITRELSFPDLAKAEDATRINEQLVVTVDAQLFYGLLEALPYLINYPYECTEQTLNRFLSTGILTSLYDRYPQVGRMAEALSKRETPYETFDAADPNRKMSMEETPWLITARGGKDAGYGIENVLDPRVAKAQREASLAKLLKAQTSLGAFPWWPGGPPSPYMTLYIVHGFSKALEFGVDVPKDPIVRAFGYLHRHFLDETINQMTAKDEGWEFVTFLNYILSNYPDSSWTGGVFSDEERKKMLDFSFLHWKQHSPYLKGYLALTLRRMGRPRDAGLVWDSVMDSAKTTADEGTSWAPEDRGWLWYNDTIETHAFALRTLMELEPKDERSEGLVQWLFLNKKLNHWKSTRATSEVVYSVAYFLKTTGALGTRETVLVDACNTQTTFTFEPDKYTGKKNQVVFPGEKLSPDCATVRARKDGKGMAFISATWHFSTEKMPERGEGDLFAVERSYFLRTKRGDEIVRKPLAEGVPLAVGDEIEVQLSIRARHPAEYVHLRDPRPSGCEPVTLTSGYRWDLGLTRYEEIRDSGTNFFLEWLPQGEYTLKHRLRCAMAGTFKAAPATLQSMYAPEFAAYSAGHVIHIK